MCDTFVALNSATSGNFTIFGKNSDRPDNEVQLVVYIPHKKHKTDTKLKCTYIPIPQLDETASVLLSQPWWMWGAEMGVNEHGVTIGNEACWTNQPYEETGLLGMDLVRLGLERGKSAEKATQVIIKLLDKYGQGGRCSFDGNMIYHNSFLIADYEEAWILETAGKWWIAEKIKKGVRNISNGLSINNSGTIRKEGLIDFVIDKGLCDDKDDFSFAKVFSNDWSEKPSPYSREGMCNLLLDKNKGKIDTEYASSILREHNSGICMHGGFTSSGSQISTLGQNEQSINFFTATNNPCKSTYHPFNFNNENFGLTNPGPYNQIDKEWIWMKYENITLSQKQIADFRKNEKDQFHMIKKSNFLELDILELNKKSWKKYYDLMKLS